MRIDAVGALLIILPHHITMEPAGPGLTALPVELIHHISRYLSVQDVLSCSLTCYYLRAALNDNCVWRKYLPQDISSLETKEQQVSPIFEMGESLTPLCEMRQQFTRKTHLMNNWRAGNCVQYSSSSELPFCRRRRFRNVPERVVENSIYKSKYIFLYHPDGIQIWDVSKNPTIHTIFKNEHFTNSLFFIVGSYLILIEFRTVGVYHINLPDKDFPLWYSFIFTENNVKFNTIVTDGTGWDEWWEFSFVRNYLMLTSGNILHIWNIDSASKVGCFELPTGDNVRLCSFMGNICLLQCRPYYSDDYLVTFNLDNSQFSNNRLSVTNERKYSYVGSKIFNYYVTVIQKSREPNCDELYEVICTLYDITTCLELGQKMFTSNKANIKFIDVLLSPVVNGTYVITCHDALHVINASTLDIVNTFNCDTTSIRSYFTMFDNIIALEAYNYRGIFEKDLLKALWDVNKKHRLLRDFNIDRRSDLYLDSLFTKLVILNGTEITVVHLW